MATTVEEVTIDADDLPAFATRVFDHRLAHPEMIRLVAWDRLERDGAGSPAPPCRPPMTTR